MRDMHHSLAQRQCAEFLQSLNTPAFVVVAWKRPDGSVDMIQSIKDMDAFEYVKAMHYAVNDVIKEI